MSRGPGTTVVVLATISALAVIVFFKERAARAVERVSLPGFSIEIPVGKVTEHSTSPGGGSYKVDPRSSPFGSLSRRETATPKLAVQWMAQGGTQDEWREDYLPMFATALGVAIGGKPQVLQEQTLDDRRWLFIVGEQRIPMGIGIVACDENFQVLVLYGRHRDVDRQSEALATILRSVECKVSKENRTKLAAATRLPQKFGRTADTDFEAYKSLDGEVLLINFTNGDVQRDRKVYKSIARSLLSNGFGIELQDSQVNYLADPAHDHPASLIRADLPTPGEKIYVGTLFCSEHNQTLMFMWIGAAGGDDALAQERFGEIGCPGDASQPLRRFSELAAEACAGGDRAACEASHTVD